MAQVVRNGKECSSRKTGGSRFHGARVCLFTYLMEFMMSKIISAVKTFVADEDGVTAIEYGLIAALVGIALIAGATTLGGKLSDSFAFLATKMKTS